jgi:hypothetical protein
MFFPFDLLADEKTINAVFYRKIKTAKMLYHLSITQCSKNGAWQ